MENVGFDEIKEGMMSIQDQLCAYLVGATKQQFLEDVWTYEKGEGGGRTRVWEEVESDVLEKGGVNFSSISGPELPQAALASMPASLSKSEFRTTGVSVVIHPHSPIVPTIHLNVRYFEAGDLKNNDVQVWWFGGGIDLTPTYPQFSQVVQFHQTLKGIVEKHDQDYGKYKRQCDEYFYLAHRKECRGIGGIFFDHLNSGQPKRQLWEFVQSVGLSLIQLYDPFLKRQSEPYSEQQRQFQLWRRGRYVEFNLLWDRGTKFGIQSNGRTESILMSLPKTATWKYSHTPEKGSAEANLINFYLKPQDWVNLKDQDEDQLLQKANQ